MDPKALRYTKSHEWAAAAGDICTVGISQFAVDQLTDVTHLQLPKVGTKVTAGSPFGEIESVKAVFDLNAPATGEIIEVNEKAAKDPSIINSSPYSDGWMVKIKMVGGLEHLMDFEAYEQHLAHEGH